MKRNFHLLSLDHLWRAGWLDRKHDHGQEQENGSPRQHHRGHHRRVPRGLDHESLRRAGRHWLQSPQPAGRDRGRGRPALHRRPIPPRLTRGSKNPK